MFGELVGAGVNAYTAASINAANVQAQKRENQIARQREDTAYTRAVIDAKRAGISPLAVSGTSGFSAQSMPAPQVSENPVSRGLETFNQLRLSDSQLAYNNALSAKTVEETKGQAISNSNAQAQYSAKLIKLLEESSKIHTETSREAEFLREYRHRLQEELKGLRLGNEAQAVDTLIKDRSRVYNENLSLNPATSWSSSASSPVGYGLATASAAMKNANNAFQDKQNKENLYQDYVRQYRQMFEGMMNDWKKSYESAKSSFKGSPDAYHKLQKWLKDNPKPVYKVPSRKDFGI